jgi:cytochrome b pre-mRNA-processing protein 3
MAASLYHAAVTRARDPWFYLVAGVPDTVEGRYELVAIHVHLLLRRLRGDGGAALGQALFDLMFADLDQSLRELGVSDVVIGKRVKAVARGFYGRVVAYDEGFDGADTVLEAALTRNLYRGQAPSTAAIGATMAALRVADRALAAAPAPPPVLWPAMDGAL